MKTKQELLLEWAKGRGLFNTVDVQKWGISHGYSRACRTMRFFTEEGKKVFKKLKKQALINMGILEPNSKSVILWYRYEGDF